MYDFNFLVRGDEIYFIRGDDIWQVLKIRGDEMQPNKPQLDLTSIQSKRY